jgi:hypothetical protein
MKKTFSLSWGWPLFIRVLGFVEKEKDTDIRVQGSVEQERDTAIRVQGFREKEKVRKKEIKRKRKG